MAIQLSELIDTTVVCLERLSLSEDTIKDYRQSAFRPLEKRVTGQGCVDSELIRLQEIFFFQQFEDGTMARHTLNWRIRGIRMLVEIFDIGNFTWKVFGKKQKECLPEPFCSVLDSFMQTQSCGKKHKDCINSICQRFLLSVSGNGGWISPVSHLDISGTLWSKFQNRGQRTWMISFTHCVHFSQMPEESRPCACRWGWENPAWHKARPRDRNDCQWNPG